MAIEGEMCRKQEETSKERHNKDNDDGHHDHDGNKK